MVRLEKLLWEQVANVKQFGRQRQITTPSKWYNENRHDSMKVMAQESLNTGISGAVFRFFEPFISQVTYKWSLDWTYQKGLTLEDLFLFQDRQLRRCPYFENQARSSLHPYTWLFFKRRRARYYKVERAVRGCYVPPHIRQEAENRTVEGLVENKEIWEQFNYKEYQSDQTPTGRWSILSKWIPLDFFCWYGLFRPEAWERYFYNETHYEGYSQADIKNAQLNPFPNMNLKTNEGRKRFEEQVERFISIYPNSITRPGEKYDYKAFYAKYDLLSGNDTSRHDQNLIESFKTELTQNIEFRKDTEKGDGSGAKIGKTLPDFMREKPGKALF